MIFRKEREAGKDMLTECVNAGQKQKACTADEHKCIILTFFFV